MLTFSGTVVDQWLFQDKEYLFYYCMKKTNTCIHFKYGFGLVANLNGCDRMKPSKLWVSDVGTIFHPRLDIEGKKRFSQLARAASGSIFFTDWHYRCFRGGAFSVHALKGFRSFVFKMSPVSDFLPSASALCILTYVNQEWVQDEPVFSQSSVLLCTWSYMDLSLI